MAENTTKDFIDALAQGKNDSARKKINVLI